MQGGVCKLVGFVPCPPTDEFCWSSRCLTNLSQSSRFPLSLENPGERLGLYCAGWGWAGQSPQRDAIALGALIAPCGHPWPSSLAFMSCMVPVLAAETFFYIEVNATGAPEPVVSPPSFPPSQDFSLSSSLTRPCALKSDMVLLQRVCFWLLLSLTATLVPLLWEVNVDGSNHRGGD